MTGGRHIHTGISDEDRATLEAIQQTTMAELEQRNKVSDKIVSISSQPHGLMVLAASGRMFFRELDGRANMNSIPGQQPKYLWREVEGPTL